jgi:hypothetical protein
MAFIPWALWGLYQWLDERGPRHWYHLLGACLGIALISLSSNPLSLVVLPLLGFYVFFLAWRARSWNALLRGGGVLLLGLGLSAYFWLPALLERNWVKTFRLLSDYFNYQNHFVYLRQLLSSTWGYGLSLPGLEDGMSFELGWVQLATSLAALLVYFLLRRRQGKAPHGAHLWFFIAVLLGVILLVNGASSWLWDQLTLLQYLEFPWRILALGSLALAYISAYPLVGIASTRVRSGYIIIVIAGLFVTGLAHAKPEGYYQVVDGDYDPQVVAEQNIAVTTAREYEPIRVESVPEGVPPPERLLLVEGEARLLDSRITGTRYIWKLDLANPSLLRVATFYYPGWELHLDGESLPIQVNNPYGLIDFSLPAGAHTVEMTFSPTALRLWARAISVVALVLIILVTARLSASSTS